MKGCGGTATFSLSEGGKRKFVCTYCDCNGFADKDGAAYKRMGETIKPAEPPADPAPAPAAPAAAPRVARTLLDRA